MKRTLSVLLLLTILSGVLAACNTSEGQQMPETSANVTEQASDAPETTDSSAPETTEPEVSEPETSEPAATESETALTEHETTVGTIAPDTQPQDTEEVTQPEPQVNLTDPVFSVAGGLYTDAQSLHLSAPEGTDYTVRYTTDGSVPSKKSEAFKDDITVPGKDACVIRAACFDASGEIVGHVVTHTYIKASESAAALYTVSLTLDPDDFDDLCAHFTEKIEMPTHIEIVTPDGQRVISQDGGMRIFGGSSRSLSQKSFKIIARKTGHYGTDLYEGKGTFRYAFFEDRIVRDGKDEGKVLDRYDSLILRNGGNDSLLHNSCDPLHASLLRDNAVNNFAAHVTDTLDFACSAFAVVYVNGEYYGILDMKENMNEDYVKRVYGVLDDDVVVVKSELDTSRGGRFDGEWFYYDSENATELAAWEDICADVAKAYKKGNTAYYEKLAELVDMRSLAEYFALNLYTSNTDWPHNNVKLWRYTGAPIEGIEITDGKWRFMTRDCDLGLGRYDSANVCPELDTTFETDTFYRTLGNFVDYHAYYSYSGTERLYPDSLGLQCMLAYCLQNDAFRAEFVKICEKMASDESVELLLAELSLGANAIKPEMNRHLERWGWAIGNGYNLKAWQKEYSAIKKYVNNRPAYFMEQLERALDLMGE